MTISTKKRILSLCFATLNFTSCPTLSDPPQMKENGAIE